MKDKIAAVFDIVKWEDDYTLEEFQILHSHPSLEQVFLFEEDMLGGFLSTEYWEGLKPNHTYRVFIVISISPYYSTNYEYGISELDGWDWDTLILTHEDLGEVEDDTSVEPK